MTNQDIHSIKQLNDILQYKPFILDVRTKQEFCQGHLYSAINIETPVPPLSNKNITELTVRLKKLGINKNSVIIVYCKLGIRANKAKNILKSISALILFSIFLLLYSIVMRFLTRSAVCQTGSFPLNNLSRR